MTRNSEETVFDQRLLLVITGLGWGGAESQVIDLALRFHARGWDVAVAVLLGHAERRVALEDQGIAVHTLGMRRGVPDLRALVRFVRVVQAFKPTVVHAHMVHANLLTRLARMVVYMPVHVSTAHSMVEGGRLRELAYRLTDPLTNWTTNVSHHAADRYSAVGAVPADRISAMPNGVDLTRFGPDEAVRERLRAEWAVGDRFVWLAVGRFESVKDYPTMLDAFGEIVGHSLCPVLVVAGDGPLRQEISALAASYGDAVRILGVRPDIPDLMRASDGFLLSSIHEGLPMVLLEAAAVGLPIVATDVGGVSEIVTEGRTGFLAPSSDAAALATAARRLLDLAPDERQALGAEGRTVVAEAYDAEVVVDRWAELYTSLSRHS